MASKKVNIDITTRADTSGAQKAATSLDGLAAAGTRAGTGAESAAKGAGRVGQVASAAGFQVQDFAVQVAGGTSALTAMAQQAPQFLGVFGPGGAIAGALIAVGSIAAKVFLGMGDDAAAAKEEAAFLADAVKQIGENAGKAVKEDVDFGLSKIQSAETAALKLVGAYNLVKDAANASQLAELTNKEKIREIETGLAKLRGEQVDEADEINKKAQAEAEIRQEQGRQQIELEKRRKEEADQIASAKQQALADSQAELDKTKLQQEAETKKLETLREQRDVLKEIAEKGYFEVTPQDVASLGMPAGTTSSQARDEAARRLAQEVMPQLEVTETRLNNLQKLLAEQGGTLVTAVETATIAFSDAMKNAQEVAAAVAIKIPEIQQSFNVDAIKGEFDAVAATAELITEEVRQIAERARPENNGQRAALDLVNEALASNGITADETAKVAAAIRVLNGSIDTSMKGVSTNVEKLINIMADFERRQNAMQKRIDGFQSNARSSGN